MSVLAGIPPKRHYMQIPTDEWEAVQAELAKLKQDIVKYADVVIEDWEALKAENTAMKYLLSEIRENMFWEDFDANDVIEKVSVIIGYKALPPKPEGEPDAEVK